VRFNSWLAALWYRRHINIEKRYSKKKKGSNVRIPIHSIFRRAFNQPPGSSQTVKSDKAVAQVVSIAIAVVASFSQFLDGTLLS
jgi:hypothetical protein